MGQLTDCVNLYDLIGQIYDKFSENKTLFQVQQFRCLQNDAGPIMNNCRPIQCINDRKVTYYVENQNGCTSNKECDYCS